jgi:hypothetical protein
VENAAAMLGAYVPAEWADSRRWSWPSAHHGQAPVHLPLDVLINGAGSCDDAVCRTSSHSFG